MFNFFAYKDYFKAAPWFKNWETKPVHSAQCRHVVVCTHQIRRKRTWESLLKTIWDWESQPYQVSNMNHTLSKLPIKFNLLVCQVCCCAGARIILLLFFSVCRAPNHAPERTFYSRFVVRQIVLQRVLFFTACRAPNRSPMRAFFSRFFGDGTFLFELSFTREAWLPQKGFDRRSRRDVGR